MVLTIFTLLAITGFGVLFILLIKQAIGVNSSRFKRIVVIGMIIYIAGVTTLPWIMPGYIK
jgi:hypothetical protein